MTMKNLESCPNQSVIMELSLVNFYPELTQLNFPTRFRQLDLRTAGTKVHDALLWREPFRGRD